jgi:hypothetical protein
MKNRERLRRLKELKIERREGALFKSANDCMVWIDEVAPLLKYDQDHYRDFLAHAQYVRIPTLSADLIMSHLNPMIGIVDQAVFELENRIGPPGFGVFKKVWQDSFWGKVLISVVAGIILIFAGYFMNKFVIPVTTTQQSTAPTPSHNEPITISISTVPRSGTGEDAMETIAGSAKGIDDPQQYRVVIYAFSDNVWYVQPQADQPFTIIQTDGSWSTETHLGSEYASLIVRPTFRPRPQNGSLPGGADVFATARVKGRQSTNAKGGKT